MERRAAFCSACDRNVPVLVEAPDWDDRIPSIRDVREAVVCLDYGVRCTGAMCPMFRAPTEEAEALTSPELAWRAGQAWRSDLECAAES